MRAHHLGDDGDADDGQDPQDQHRPAAVVAGAGQTFPSNVAGGLLGPRGPPITAVIRVRFIIDELYHRIPSLVNPPQQDFGWFVYERSAAAAAGRRPGNVDTRGEIVEAAKRVFAAKGYDGASLRAVPREAEVDPALVHHYFDGKASLFVAAMALPFDPRTPRGGAPGLAGRIDSSGTMVITSFLTMWTARRNGLLVRRLCRGDGGVGERGRRDARIRRRTGLGRQPGERGRERGITTDAALSCPPS